MRPRRISIWPCNPDLNHWGKQTDPLWIIQSVKKETTLKQGLKKYGKQTAVGPLLAKCLENYLVIINTLSHRTDQTRAQSNTLILAMTPIGLHHNLSSHFMDIHMHHCVICPVISVDLAQHISVNRNNTLRSMWNLSRTTVKLFFSAIATQTSASTVYGLPQVQQNQQLWRGKKRPGMVSENNGKEMS